MSKKREMLHAFISEYEYEFRWLAKVLKVDYELGKEMLAEDFDVVVKLLRLYAYDEQHKNAEDGNNGESEG